MLRGFETLKFIFSLWLCCRLCRCPFQDLYTETFYQFKQMLSKTPAFQPVISLLARTVQLFEVLHAGIAVQTNNLLTERHVFSRKLKRRQKKTLFDIFFLIFVT